MFRVGRLSLSGSPIGTSVRRPCGYWTPVWPPLRKLDETLADALALAIQGGLLQPPCTAEVVRQRPTPVELVCAFCKRHGNSDRPCLTVWALIPHLRGMRRSDVVVLLPRAFATREVRRPRTSPWTGAPVGNSAAHCNTGWTAGSDFSVDRSARGVHGSVAWPFTACVAALVGYLDIVSFPAPSYSCPAPFPEVGARRLGPPS